MIIHVLLKTPMEHSNTKNSNPCAVDAYFEKFNVKNP